MLMPPAELALKGQGNESMPRCSCRRLALLVLVLLTLWRATGFLLARKVSTGEKGVVAWAGNHKT